VTEEGKDLISDNEDDKISSWQKEALIKQNEETNQINEIFIKEDIIEPVSKRQKISESSK